MRWSYLVPRLILLTLVWAFFAFAFDPLLRWTIVEAGQQALAARVEIGGLRTGFFPPSASLQTVRIANPAETNRNLLEAEEIDIRLDGDALLRKCYIIESGTIGGLRWDTTRSDDGSVERKSDWNLPGAGPFEALGRRAKEAGGGLFDVLTDNARQQLDPDRLESVRVSRERHAAWEQRLDRLQDRADELKRRVDQLEDLVKSKGNTLERLQQYQQAAAEAQRLLYESEQIRRELGQFGPIAQQDLRDIDAARLRDQQKLEQGLAVLRLDGDAIAEALLGPELAERLGAAVGWINWAAENLSRTAGELEPERGRGIDVAFAIREPLPKFLIQSLDVSGEATWGQTTLPFRGQVAGFTNEPRVYGKPAVIQLAGEQGGTFEVTARLDHTGEVPVHDVELVYHTAEPMNWTVGDAAKFPLQIAAQQSRVEARIRLAEDDLAGTITLAQQPVAVVAADTATANDAARMLQAVAQSIDRLQASVELSGTPAEPRWKLRSNLGEQLAAGMEQSLRRELLSQQQQLALQLDNAVRAETDGLRQLVNSGYGDLFEQLNLSESHVRGLLKNAGGGMLDVNRLLRR